MDAAPLVRYPVRTPGWVWWVIGGCAAVSAYFLSVLLSLPLLDVTLTLAILGASALVLGLPVLALVLSRRYRVGAPTIDVYADRVEVPRPFRGRDRFAIDALAMERLRMMQQVSVGGVPTGARLDRGVVVTFRAGARRRELSDRVFSRPDHLGALVDDLAAVKRGERPGGPEAYAQARIDAAAAQRAERAGDRWEAALDRELDADRGGRGEPSTLPEAKVRRR